MVAVHAAQAAAKAREKVVDAFRLRGATAAERALPLNELGLASDDRVVGALVESGVVRGVDRRGRPAVIGYEESRVEGYYLDEAAVISARDRASGSSTRVAVIVLGIVAVLILLPLLFLAFRQG